MQSHTAIIGSCFFLPDNGAGLDSTYIIEFDCYQFRIGAGNDVVLHEVFQKYKLKTKILVQVLYYLHLFAIVSHSWQESAKGKRIKAVYAMHVSIERVSAYLCRIQLSHAVSYAVWISIPVLSLLQTDIAACEYQILYPFFNWFQQCVCF